MICLLMIKYDLLINIFSNELEPNDGQNLSRGQFLSGVKSVLNLV